MIMDSIRKVNDHDDDDNMLPASGDIKSVVVASQHASNYEDIFYAMMNGEEMGGGGSKDKNNNNTFSKEEMVVVSPTLSPSSCPAIPTTAVEAEDFDYNELMSSFALLTPEITNADEMIAMMTTTPSTTQSPPTKASSSSSSSSSLVTMPSTIKRSGSNKVCDLTIKKDCKSATTSGSRTIQRSQIVKSTASSTRTRSSSGFAPPPSTFDCMNDHTSSAPTPSSSFKKKKQQKSKNKKGKSIFYQLANEVRTEYELREKAERFKACVDVRDRWKKLVLYKSSFIGSEAVDAMLYTNLASSRKEAVQLARQFALELNLFRPVQFQDNDTYYQYATTTTSISPKKSTTTSLVSSSSSSPSSMKMSIAAMRRKPRSTINDDSVKSLSDTVNTTTTTTASTIASSSTSPTTTLDEDEHQQRLNHMAKAFKACVEVGDRRYRLKTYKSCFVGSDAVECLLKSKLVATKKDAVEFARELQRELNLFQHVTGDHAFSDDKLFFRFTEDGPMNSRLLPMQLATL